MKLFKKKVVAAPKSLADGVESMITQAQRRRTLLDAFGNNFTWSERKQRDYICWCEPDSYPCQRCSTTFECMGVFIRSRVLDSTSLDGLRKRFGPELLKAVRAERDKHTARAKVQLAALQGGIK